jgi:hypothetical protein
MERLWIREVRRAARRASAPFARQVALGCGAAAVGTMVASLLPLLWDGPVAKAVWAALWAVAGYIVIWTGLFIGCTQSPLHSGGEWAADRLDVQR